MKENMCEDVRDDVMMILSKMAPERSDGLEDGGMLNIGQEERKRAEVTRSSFTSQTYEHSEVNFLNFFYKEGLINNF